MAKWPVVRFLIALLVVLLSAPAFADFPEWLKGFRHEAVQRGISGSTLDAVFADLAPIPRVIELDSRQPEFTRTFSDYLSRVVPDNRVENARKRLAENQELLQRVEKEFSVDRRIVVALWAVESDFGRLTGGFPVFGALATLAYEGRRSDFFRRELLEALLILEQGHARMEQMSGSWAGAMGQVQFMPTTFRNYAVDFDQDGRIDIWSSRADALASAANYLSRSGWKKNAGWGEPVRLPPGFDTNLAGLQTRKAIGEWKALGVGGIRGSAATMASLLLPEGPDGPAFLVYDNFRVLMKWNRSVSFALAVGHLADRIQPPGGTRKSGS